MKYVIIICVRECVLASLPYSVSVLVCHVVEGRADGEDDLSFFSVYKISQFPLSFNVYCHYIGAENVKKCLAVYLQHIHTISSSYSSVFCECEADTGLFHGREELVQKI